jgi:hypothetical protein
MPLINGDEFGSKAKSHNGYVDLLIAHLCSAIGLGRSSPGSDNGHGDMAESQPS